MSGQTFAADLKKEIQKRKDWMLFIAVNSIQDVMEAAMTPQLGITKGASGFVEGKIPVAEADLINSLTTDGIPGADSYVLVVSSMKLGDSITFAWTAEHAKRMEFGYTGTDSLGRTYNQPGRHFVGKNAARFPEFAEARAREAIR